MRNFRTSRSWFFLFALIGFLSFSSCRPDAPACNNDCLWAEDGECDDGREGSDTNYCGLGTDCQDCGEL